MDTQETTLVLAELQSSWPRREMTDPEAAVWVATLAPLDFASTSAALASLRLSTDWMPTHREVVEAAQWQQRVASLAANSRPALIRQPCARCDDTGWENAATAGGGDAVARCACSASSVGTEHGIHCSCRTCHYGEQRAADIAMGVDGARRSGVDPLAKVGSEW